MFEKDGITPLYPKLARTAAHQVVRHGFTREESVRVGHLRFGMKLKATITTKL